MGIFIVSKFPIYCENGNFQIKDIYDRKFGSFEEMGLKKFQTCAPTPRQWCNTTDLAAKWPQNIEKSFNSLLLMVKPGHFLPIYCLGESPAKSFLRLTCENDKTFLIGTSKPKFGSFALNFTGGCSCLLAFNNKTHFLQNNTFQQFVCSENGTHYAKIKVENSVMAFRKKQKFEVQCLNRILLVRYEDRMVEISDDIDCLFSGTLFFIIFLWDEICDVKKKCQTRSVTL